MANRATPETIENDWDRFYWDFPDIYDRFAVTSPRAVSAIDRMFGLRDKVIVDVGSGTGRSTFELAKTARLVIGIEPWAPMRDLAIEKARAIRAQNVAFLEGVAQGLPLRDRSVDLAVTILGVPLDVRDGRKPGRLIGEVYVPEAEQAVRRGGYIVSVEGAPGSFRRSAREGRSSTGTPERMSRLLSGRFNFQHRDVYVMQEYSSLQEAIDTYGFIYGKRAIDYLMRHKKKRFRSKFRVHYKQV